MQLVWFWAWIWAGFWAVWYWVCIRKSATRPRKMIFEVILYENWELKGTY
ncbi:hypothetical protein Hanom_Chr10g00911911 [Helianthus anomalus]